MATNSGPSQRDSTDEAAKINLKVKGQDGHGLFFRIKRDTQLMKLMTAFCERKETDYWSTRFLYNGQRITGKLTPDQLDMENGDEIDAMTYQTGGGCKILYCKASWHVKCI
ncbi:Small ubiquitin-related modifier [Quillaja saponaria]|uniref:Small ubiquitin-related modifier n=1 Tax=Quillaja saponaria TaxID=32244 RepID=A0AAD7PZ97_QUISA|nr:Small ubiquitin-related modifier [Quillaja saponaria]